MNHQPDRPTLELVWTLALGVLLLATLILWLLVGVRVRSGASTEIEGYALISLLSFHACLLGLWSGLGRWPGRWFVAVVLGIALGFIAWYARDTSEVWEFQTFTLGSLLVVAAAVRGLRLHTGDLQLIGQARSAERRALQFNIKRILLWTAGIAILLAVYRALSAWIDWDRVGLIESNGLPQHRLSRLLLFDRDAAEHLGPATTRFVGHPGCFGGRGDCGCGGRAQSGSCLWRDVRDPLTGHPVPDHDRDRHAADARIPVGNDQ